MIDIDFLIMAIKDKELEIHKSSMEYFIVIGENFMNKKREIRGWNILLLTHPENGKCHFQIAGNDSPIQSVSINDYNRINELLEVEEVVEPLSKFESNQEMIMNYLRRKVKDYDNINGVNKKL